LPLIDHVDQSGCERPEKLEKTEARLPQRSGVAVGGRYIGWTAGACQHAISKNFQANWRVIVHGGISSPDNSR